MREKKKKSPSIVEYITWFFFILLGFTPLWAAYENSREAVVSEKTWVFVSIWLALLAAIFLFTRGFCGSKDRPYIQGLYWVTHSMFGRGNVIFILFLIFPSLLFVFFASFGIALLCFVTGRSGYAPVRYQRLIGF